MASGSPFTEGPARWIVIGVAAVAAITGGIMWMNAGHESTDDAQVEGRITQIAARVGGPILDLKVTDNQYVEKGTVLAVIDPREYQVAVDRAEAELADAQANALAAGTNVPIATVATSSDLRTAGGSVEEARAGVTVADRQVDAARAQLTAAEARVREQQAAITRTTRDVERLKPLVAKEEVAQQQFDSAVAAADAAKAAGEAAQSDVESARAAVAVAEQRALQARASSTRADAALASARTAPEQLRVSRARAAAADARVKQAAAVLAQAQLNLERTTIIAPSAGIIGKRSIELGQQIQPGQPLFALVTRDDVWVVANFKETQLADMRPGQIADIEVDALGGRSFTGKIDSIGAATGARFSLLPPENATGNYVKVVQRVPVKIVLDPGQDPEHQLRPGLSVVPTVHTK
ncbi:MAG: HlyD family secretion protein [Acidobacteria bacterium]|nr:HlyD family secretion protein [Acidobacteriota bacterium]